MLGLALKTLLKWLQNAFNGNGKVHLDLINSLLWLCRFRIRFSKSNNCQNNADKEQIIPSGSHPKCISSDEFLPQFVKRCNGYFSTKEYGNFYLFAPRFAPRLGNETIHLYFQCFVTITHANFVDFKQRRSFLKPL